MGNDWRRGLRLVYIMSTSSGISCHREGRRGEWITVEGGGVGGWQYANFIIDMAIQRLRRHFLFHTPLAPRRCPCNLLLLVLLLTYALGFLVSRGRQRTVQQ